MLDLVRLLIPFSPVPVVKFFLQYFHHLSILRFYACGLEKVNESHFFSLASSFFSLVLIKVKKFNFEVNSTGFLVQNYENLFDTNINAFFDAFKTQIKSVSIKSNDVISFFGGLSFFMTFFSFFNNWSVTDDILIIFFGLFKIACRLL